MYREKESVKLQRTFSKVYIAGMSILYMPDKRKSQSQFRFFDFPPVQNQKYGICAADNECVNPWHEMLN